MILQSFFLFLLESAARGKTKKIAAEQYSKALRFQSERVWNFFFVTLEMLETNKNRNCSTKRNRKLAHIFRLSVSFFAVCENSLNRICKARLLPPSRSHHCYKSPVWLFA